MNALDSALKASLAARGQADFRWSILHDAVQVANSSEYLVDYVCRRSNLSRSDAEQIVTRHDTLASHLADRHPWWVNKEAPKLEWKSEIRVSTLCINIGVLHCLKLMEAEAAGMLKLSAGFVSPIEYWTASHFSDCTDCFITEVCAPKLSGVAACSEFDIAFPIHYASEGWLTYDRMTFLNGLNLATKRRKQVAAIVAASTSSESQATERGLSIGVRLSSPVDFKSFANAMSKSKEVLFAWDPWIDWIVQSVPGPPLYVSREGKFAMALFVNRACWADPDRASSVKQFITSFVTRWIACWQRSAEFGIREIDALAEVPGWISAIKRAGAAMIATPLLHVAGSDCGLRNDCIAFVNELRLQLPHDATIVGACVGMFGEIEDLVNSWPEESLPAIFQLLRAEVADRRRPAADRAEKVLGVLRMSLGRRS